MPYEKGGRADKLGNKYENWWLVRQMLRLINEEISSLVVEAIGEGEVGVDLWIKNKDGSKECYQCKGRNASNEHWTMGHLATKGIFTKAKEQLVADNSTCYHFVSPLTNTMLKDITNRARNSNDPVTFYNHQILPSRGKSEPGNDPKIEECYQAFCECIGLEVNCEADRATAYDYLKRVHLILFPDDIDTKRSLLKDIGFLFVGNQNAIFNLLASYPTENDALGHAITANQIIAFLRDTADISLRQLHRNQRILPRIRRLNEEFLESFTPINKALIPRLEAGDCYSGVENGHSYILHGRAGCGKSGVVYQLARMLDDTDIAYLALRLDRRFPDNSAERYGEGLGLPASPALCLDAIAVDNEAVLILDQLDAVRWTSAHSGTALDVCKEMIDEVAQLNKMRQKKISVVVVCRTFDFKNDRGIQSLFEQKNESNVGIKWNEKLISELDDETVEHIVGDPYVKLSPKLKSLLRNPSNLYIWTNIGGKAAVGSIKTAGDLVEMWWRELRKKSAVIGVSDQQLVTLKDRLVTLIDDMGSLFIPITLLEECSPHCQDYLLSNGMLLVSEGAKIGFVHQGFYDYFSMAKMQHSLYSGSTILEAIGPKEKQTPLRRYHFQMMLENILAADVDKFIEVGKTLLGSGDVRFIMKHAYLAVMGQANDPQPQLLAFVAKLFEDPYWKMLVFESVLYGNAQLIKALIENGRIQDWIALEGERSVALGLLQSVNRLLQDDVVSILSAFAFETDEMDKALYNILCWDSVDDSDLMFEFRLKMLHRNVNLAGYTDWRTLVAGKPLRALALLKFFVFEKDRISNWDHQYIERADINNLKAVAQSNAKRVWQEFMPFLFEQTQGLSNRYDAEFHFWETVQYPKHIFGRVFIDLIKAAASALISEDSDNFLEMCSPYFAQSTVVVDEILLFVLNELPSQHSDFVVSWLAEKPNDRLFEYTSENDEHLLLAKTAIRKHSQTCSRDAFMLLESAISYFHEKDEVASAKWSFDYNHKGRQEGTNAMLYYPYWGQVQNYLLSSLDGRRLSKNTKDLIAVLKRKFADSPPPHVRAKATGGSIGSTIGSVAEKISDKQWLRIIQNKKPSKRFFERRSISGGFLESSPEQFAGTLERLGGNYPTRVAHLALHFDETTDSQYIRAAFSVIGKTKSDAQTGAHDDWQPVDKDIAEQIFLMHGKRSNVATEFSRAVANRAGEEWCDEVLVMLSEIAKTHPNPEAGTMLLLSSKEGKETVHALLTTAINCTRGCAARAIAQVLWEDESRYDLLKDAIKSAVFDEHLAVNMAAVDCILPMCNFDRDTAINWLSYMVSKDIRIAAHYSINNIYFSCYEEHREFVMSTVLAMYHSEYDDVSERGAAYMANLYLLYGDFEDVVFCASQKTTAQTKGLLHTCVELLQYPQHYENAKEIIAHHLDSVDEESNYMLHRVFDCDTVDVETDSEFIAKVVTSRQNKLMMHYFVDFIEKRGGSLIAFSDIIFAICHTLVARSNGNAVDLTSGLYNVANDLSKLITSLYEQTRDRSDLIEINQQCLDMWDTMFEYRIGAIRELSQSIMEQ